MKKIKSITFWSLEESNIYRAIDRAKEAGFDAIELVFLEEGVISEQYEVTTLYQLYNYALQKEIKFSSISTLLASKYRISSNDWEERKKAFDIVLNMIDIAQLLHIETISYSIGYITRDENYIDAFIHCVSFLKKISYYAEEKQVFVCIENINGNFLQTPLEYYCMLEQVNSDYIQCCLDIGNASINGYVEHWLVLLQGKIKKLHLTNICKRYGGLIQYVSVEKGDIYNDKVLQELSFINTYFTLEIIPRKNINLKEECMKLESLIDEIN